MYIQALEEQKLLHQLTTDAHNVIKNNPSVSDWQDLFDRAQKKIPAPLPSPVSFADVDACVTEQIGRYYTAGSCTFIPTGINALDKTFGGGLQPGFYIIGARTNVGKTEFGADIALGMAENGATVQYDQLELDKIVFFEKLIAKFAGHNRGSLVKGLIDPKKVNLAKDKLRALPLLTTSAPYDIKQLTAYCAQNKGKFDALIIDQFSEIIPMADKKDHLLALNEIVHGVFRISKDLRIPVIMLAQINREADRGAAVREPRLSDLKDTGTLEQAADVVILLSRPNKGERDDYLGVHIAKDRIMENSGHKFKLYRRFGRLTSEW
jgi:replicative DNA helicase